MVPKPLSRRRLRSALFGHRRGDERQEEKACSTPALGGDPLDPAEGGWATGFFCIVSFLSAMLLGLRPAGVARPPKQTRSFYRRASPSSGTVCCMSGCCPSCAKMTPPPLKLKISDDSRSPLHVPPGRDNTGRRRCVGDIGRWFPGRRGHSQEDPEKRRFRVRECWDLSTHREPRSRTRRSVCE